MRSSQLWPSCLPSRQAASPTQTCGETSPFWAEGLGSSQAILSMPAELEGVLLLDLPIPLPGFRMPSRGVVLGRQPLAPHQCCGPWRPLFMIASELSLLFFPPDHHHHLVALPLHPGWDALPTPNTAVPTISGDPISYPASIHLVPPAHGAPHTSC